MSEKREKRLRFWNKFMYCRDFEQWLAQEPPMWKIRKWRKWKNRRPEAPEHWGERQ